MSYQPTTRNADDALLEMIALRMEGWTSNEIGETLGFKPEHVRASTNRVVHDDAKLHDDKIVFPKVIK